MQFKKDKYIIDEEEFTVEGEWLNGVPHGVCIFESKDGRRGSFEYIDNGEPKGISR